jgi:hypothetical protein
MASPKTMNLSGSGTRRGQMSKGHIMTKLQREALLQAKWPAELGPRCGYPASGRRARVRPQVCHSLAELRGNKRPVRGEPRMGERNPPVKRGPGLLGRNRMEKVSKSVTITTHLLPIIHISHTLMQGHGWVFQSPGEWLWWPKNGF